MNLKHEMFWNKIKEWNKGGIKWMNLKHEMFWNKKLCISSSVFLKWTLNMKCFEIDLFSEVQKINGLWTLNMKCFEI